MAITIPGWLHKGLGILRKWLNALNAGGIIPSKENGPNINTK